MKRRTVSDGFVEVSDEADGTTHSRVVTASTIEEDADSLVVCNSATDMTYYLLPAVGSNRVAIVSNVGTGVVTISPALSDTINGETYQTIYQGDTIDMMDYTIGKFVII